jgi:hypothetical protein
MVTSALLCLATAGVIFLNSDTLLWWPFLILAAFFFAKDVIRAGVRKQAKPSAWTDFSGPYGVLGEYHVDGDDCYGLYISLLGRNVFVDIRKDELLKQREQYAVEIFNHQKILEQELEKFISASPAYESRFILYVGLHSAEPGRGEVFWEPSGYTLLKGYAFVLE